MILYLRTRILASDLDSIPHDILIVESLRFRVGFKVPKVSAGKTSTDAEVWNLSEEDIKYVEVSESSVDTDYMNVDWIVSMEETAKARYFRNRYFDGHQVSLVEVIDAIVSTTNSGVRIPNEIMEVEFSSNGQSWFRQEHVLNRYSIDDLLKGVLNGSLK